MTTSTADNPVLYVAYTGGELKALGNGKFKGLLIRFSEPSQPDLGNDHFTPETELFKDVGDTLPLLYEHGQDKTLKTTRLGKATITDIDDVGVWIEGQVNVANQYGKAIYDHLIKTGKAGLSSGAAPHLVKRKKSGEKNVKTVTEWGAAEASITPKPMEPLTRGLEIKSLAEFADEMVEVDWLKCTCGGGDISAEEEPVKAVGKLVAEGNSYRFRVSPDSKFDPDAFGKGQPYRTIQLSQKGPKISALIGKLKGEDSTTVATYIFPQDEWKEEEAQKWVDDHKDEQKSIPGSTVAAPNKQHAFEPQADDPDTCAVCGDEKDSDQHINAPLRKPDDGKSLLGDELDKITPSVWNLRDGLSNICRDIATAARVRNVTGADFSVEEKVTDAVSEYAARLIPLIVEQINQFVDDAAKPSTNFNGGSEPVFYLRSLPPASLHQFVKALPVPGETLDSHSARAVSAVEEFARLNEGVVKSLEAYAARVNDKIEFRRADPNHSGHYLGTPSQQKLASITEITRTASGQLKALTDNLERLQAAAVKSTGDAAPATPAETAEGSGASGLSYEQMMLSIQQAEVEAELVEV